MSNRDLKIEWALQQIASLAERFPHYNLDTFNLWKAKRDEEVRAERAAKAAEEMAKKSRALNVSYIGSTGDGKTMNAVPSLTYVVHGYTTVENGSILTAPVPKVSLLYAGPDREHADEIAIGQSRRQRSRGAQYDYTAVSICRDGQPQSIIQF